MKLLRILSCTETKNYYFENACNLEIHELTYSCFLLEQRALNM